MPSLLRSADPTKCPSCREPVHAFAAGCALCGADLDPGRFNRAPSRPARVVDRAMPARPKLGARVGGRLVLFPRWRSQFSHFYLLVLFVLTPCIAGGVVVGVFSGAIGRLIP